MAKSNFNQDHFKIGGREPIGKGILHEQNKDQFGKTRKKLEKEQSNEQPLIPGSTNEKKDEEAG
jgi:hypothetical protein